MELYTFVAWAGFLLGALKVQLAGILASRVVYSTELMSHLHIYKVCNHQFNLIASLVRSSPGDEATLPCPPLLKVNSTGLGR